MTFYFAKINDLFYVQDCQRSETEIGLQDQSGIFQLQTSGEKSSGSLRSRKSGFFYACKITFYTCKLTFTVENVYMFFMMN